MSTRTTLTLDDDVADRLAREARRSGRSYRAVVNAALRRGLDTVIDASEPFRLNSAEMRRRPEFDLDHIEDLLDRLDGPQRR
ncbi:MAG TPA: CopG family transcriptional regulator [Candidatus Limnocylindrales bacterium]|nr:CopG family transcriptional regulator [Candidatus Limnocylindrales bacterium]